MLRMAVCATSGSPSPDVSHTENATMLAEADTQSASLQPTPCSEPIIPANQH